MSASAPVPAAVPEALPLIETKLAPGRLRPERLIRRRLLTELDRCSSQALTLIDAPVGFGKTVLAQSWCAHTDSAVAWVSLDAGDNDPVRLWTYVATAVDRIRPGLGRMALARLRTQGVPATVAVDELVNGLASFGEPVAIVLDDLHAVRSDECLASLEHAVEHLPANAAIVATTRSDPALPLGRLRARGALGEIRAGDLAFRVDEARELLVEREGIALDDEDVALLVERTEGWVAGIYLAALWLRELDDPKAGVRAFHANHRHVADYLSGEVLDALDAGTRRFLLETSTLGRFSAPLCDAVLDRTDSAARIRDLERTNGFLVALDAHGEWFRFHHLFGELLQLELVATDPVAPAAIHLRAAAWCHEHGLIEEALDHSAEGGDRASVAEILRSEHLRMVRSGQQATLLRWGAELSDDELVTWPELPVAMAMAAGLRGEPGRRRRRFIALAERSKAERPELWLPYHEIALGLALVNWVDRDIAAATEVARRTVELARPNTDLAVAALTGLANLLFLAGELAGARVAVDEALARPEVEQRPHAYVQALAVLSLIDVESGRIAPGAEGARAALATARAVGAAEVASGGVAHVALASALAAQGRLRDGEREAVQGERIRHSAEPEANHLFALLVLAGIRARRGRHERAAIDVALVRNGLALFDDAGRLPALADAVEAEIARGGALEATLQEQPSAAELSVLQLLATDLSQREIGGQLFLSVNTVKTHSRSLYRKLGVASREDAVARATALGLLGDSPG